MGRTAAKIEESDLLRYSQVMYLRKTRNKGA